MTRHHNIIAVIPARYASARVPAKPLVDLCGKPMIQRVYERVKQSSLVNRVIVATDHEEIVEVVKNFGGEVVMTPAEIPSGSDRIGYVAKDLVYSDIIVNVQGDEPLISPRMIDEAITPLMQDSTIHVGTLIKQISSADELKNPNVVKVVIDSNGFAIYFSRSPIPYLRDEITTDAWHLRHPFYKHTGLYVFRRDFLLTFNTWKESLLEQIEKLEQLRIIEHGYRIKATITTFDSIPVDTLADIERVRKLIMKENAS
jgi:3-deoxy-manno-octulosonate cytidylyltransferase (CMP-KDO synthetase)